MSQSQQLDRITRHLATDERLVGFFLATQPFKVWAYLIIGPLSLMATRTYHVAVTDKGIHFHLQKGIGTLPQYDFFSYAEIESFKIGKGRLQLPLHFKFCNGRDAKFKAQKNAVKKVPKINTEILEHIKQHIRQR